MSYDLLIQGKYKREQLSLLVGLFLEIDLSNIGDLYDFGKEHDVNLEIYHVRGDFDTRLCVYKPEYIRPNAKEVDFAIFLSNNLGKNVLMTYWGNNPYLWILVQPSGRLYKVKDIPNEQESVDSKEPFLELDKNFREELDLDLVRQSLGN